VEHRYADESEPSWYTGRRYATDAGDPEVSGSHALGEGAYRLPEQREVPGEGVRMPVRGPEYPAVRPAPAPAPPPIAEPTGLIPPVAVPQPAARADSTGREADGSYRIRRPISSVVLGAVVVALLIPVLRLLADVTFAADPAARGIVPAVLLTLGLTLTAFGLFAAGGGAITRDAWLRAPLAYLPVGLIMLVAAGLAVA
jgi:hypothetical protein